LGSCNGGRAGTNKPDAIHVGEGWQEYAVAPGEDVDLMAISLQLTRHNSRCSRFHLQRQGVMRVR
jgi:hypothetical protein